MKAEPEHLPVPLPSPPAPLIPGAAENGHAANGSAEGETFWESLDLPLYPSADEIIARVNPPLSEAHAGYVRKAYEMAKAAHAGQRRASGEPYFAHCAEVALLLADLVADWPTIAAGLLHDTIEDCGFTVKHIHSQLPDPVADLVDGVTKISSLNFSSDREHQASNLRKMIFAMARDVRVVLIKLCDRLHNMRTLDYLSPEKQKAIATATIEIYGPLANRLGMEKITNELEDLAMKYLNPVFYKQLAAHLKRNQERYAGIILNMQRALEAALTKAGIQARVTGRVKHIYSIYQKMLRQGLNLTEVHDLIAMRIITKSVEATYEALGIVHATWKPVPGRFKDYIASPKPNGYRSIHTTVIGANGEISEIQIRTEDMHRMAAAGVAAHWKYKEDGSSESPEEVEAERLAWLRQIIETLSDIRDPQEFMAAIKRDVFDASVFCYTPLGDVIEMPNGSTILDFAYRIHSDVGTHCSGAKVNHKMAPLRTVIKTGDIVEIITSKPSHPTSDWLQIAITGRARNKIRHWLKTNDRQLYLDRGRTAFVEELRAKAPELEVADAMKQLETIAKQISLAGAEDALVEIGFGSVKAGAVISKMVRPAGHAPPTRKRLSKSKAKPKKPGTILVEGMPGAVVRIAKCCLPKPGEPIIGFVTQGRGISVHRPDCPQIQRARAVHAQTPGRVVAVEWSDGLQKVFKASIRVVCQDRQGLLKDISQAITTLGVSIIDVNTHSNLRLNRAIMKFTVLVENDDSLNSLLRRIESVPSVKSLTRVIHQR